MLDLMTFVVIALEIFWMVSEVIELTEYSNR